MQGSSAIQRQFVREALDAGFDTAPPSKHRVFGKLVDGVRHPPPVAEVDNGPEDDSRIWLVVYRSNGKGLGDEISIPGDATRVTLGGKPFALFSQDSEEVLARKVSTAEVTKLSSLFRMGAPEQAERDLRVIPVQYDTAEERWRTLAEAIPELEEIEFDDFPLRGPCTMFRDARQLRRQGMDFLQHHEAWLQKSGVRSTDRSVHEHANLCRVLQYMASYDQLNIASLASAEALNRRRTLIEIAHQGRPEAPSYEGAEEILGVRQSADGSLQGRPCPHQPCCEETSCKG